MTTYMRFMRCPWCGSGLWQATDTTDASVTAACSRCGYDFQSHLDPRLGRMVERVTPGAEQRSYKPESDSLGPPEVPSQEYLDWVRQEMNDALDDDKSDRHSPPAQPEGTETKAWRQLELPFGGGDVPVIPTAMPVKAVPAEADHVATRLEAMRDGRKKMATRCQEVAQAIIREAGVVTVQFHNRGLYGRARIKENAIYAPSPSTRRRLYIVAHECGHVVLKHDGSKPRHREEYEAERYAHVAMRQHGISVPKKSTVPAKKYVAWKIHQAVKRGAKSIDKESLRWCQDYLSASVRRWLRWGCLTRASGVPTHARPVRAVQVADTGPDVSPTTQA